MPIFAMAFGAEKDRKVHFRASFTKNAQTYEEADRLATLQAMALYPPKEGWAQHTIDVHEIPYSWIVEIAQAEINLREVWKVLSRSTGDPEKLRRLQDLFADMSLKLAYTMGDESLSIYPLEEQTRAYPLGVLLSATTGKTISEVPVDGFRGLHELTAFIGADPDTVGLFVLARHPELAVDTSKVTDWDKFLEDMVRKFGPSLPIRGAGTNA